MKQSYVVILSLLIGAIAFASRTVQISIPKNQSLQLSNPSSSSVNYTVECFDSAGVSKANLNQSLSPNATKVYGNTGLCAGGALPANSSSVSTVGLIQCEGSTNFTNAANLCDAFYGLCTFQQISEHGGLYSFSEPYWFNINTSNWEFSIDYGSTYSPASSTHAAASTGPSGYDKYCRVGGMSQYQCQHVPKTSSLSGALCCPAANVNLCKVTITTPSGFLSSPQFKGGSPF